MSVGIIDLGCANIASVCFALDRLEARYRVVSDPKAVDDFERIIFPGVGSARYAADRLDELGLREPLQETGKPVLGICLGMQLLFEHSDEGDARGLGLLKGNVARMRPPENDVWPHMGWSKVYRQNTESRLLRGVDDGAYAYFVHGYACPIDDASAAVANYGVPFAAMVEQGNVFGCQFHPERSGLMGSTILKNFLDAPC